MLTIGITLLATSAIPYIGYLIGIRYGKRLEPRVEMENYPPISVVVAAYNEEKNVARCITQIAYGYPDVEIIFVDDHSTDGTFDEAQVYLERCSRNYWLIQNGKQLGPAGSYTEGIIRARNDIVVTMDADVILEEDALKIIVARLLSDQRIGAVCGELRPLVDNQLSRAEGEYRSFYGRMSEWDSANGSTFNFNGALIAFRRSAVNTVSTVGADDANTAFAAIANGFRAVYEKDAIVYEKIPTEIGIQFKQKTRRAAGLLRSVWDNLRYAQPLRVWMLFISPLTFLTGSLLTLFSLGIIAIILVAAFVVFFAQSFALSFVLSQIYLTVGLVKMFTVRGSWESTSSSSHG